MSTEPDAIESMSTEPDAIESVSTENLKNLRGCMS